MLRLVAAGASLLVVLAPAGAVPARDGGRAAGPRVTLVWARAFDEFPLYNAGDRADGLPLVAILQRDDTARYVAFVYGDCTPDEGSGCAPPAEIQVWPACRRSLALYGGPKPDEPGPEWTTIRGVPAVSLDDGTRLELQTGRSTVVIFADLPARARRIADALRSLNGSELGDSPLPQPAPGALDGRLTC